LIDTETPRYIAVTWRFFRSLYCSSLRADHTVRMF